jgi:hypothetical protein
VFAHFAHGNHARKWRSVTTAFASHAPGIESSRLLCGGRGYRVADHKQQCRAALAVADGAAGRYDGACASSPTYPDNPMNRQKKIKQLLKAHAKKASAKLGAAQAQIHLQGRPAKLAARACRCQRR